MLVYVNMKEKRKEKKTLCLLELHFAECPLTTPCKERNGNQTESLPKLLGGPLFSGPVKSFWDAILKALFSPSACRSG